jgi:hypothetical protein
LLTTGIAWFENCDAMAVTQQLDSGCGANNASTDDNDMTAQAVTRAHSKAHI